MSTSQTTRSASDATSTGLAAATLPTTTPSAAPAPNSFDLLTTHRVSTMAYVAIRAIVNQARLQEQRAKHMTRVERERHIKSNWRFKGPHDPDFARDAQSAFAVTRQHHRDVRVYIATTGAGGTRVMSEVSMGQAVDITFAKIANEDARWFEFGRCFRRCLELNAGRTVIVHGDYLATPIAVPSKKVPGTLIVKYDKDPAKASFSNTNKATSPANEADPAFVRAIITDLPATLPCRHHVSWVCDSWAPPAGVQMRSVCMECLDPVIDLVQRIELPRFTIAEWDSWISTETDNLDLDRLAALAELRALPWLSREWLQVVRMVGVMFGVRDPYSPEFAATMAVSTNVRLELMKDASRELEQLEDASRVLEWMREDVVREVVWKEDEVPLSGHFASYLFDWVEQHGRDTFIESRSDLYWYLNRYCSLAIVKPASRARTRLHKLPRANHSISAASVKANFPALEQTCATVAHILRPEATSPAAAVTSPPASEATSPAAAATSPALTATSTPRSRRSRYSTSSSDSTSSVLSEESFAALVAGRLRSRTVSAQQQQLPTIAQAHEVGGEAHGPGELVGGIAGVTIGGSLEKGQQEEEAEESA